MTTPTADGGAPIAGDHHRGEHGVACERRGVGAAGDHQRHDQRHLDDRDRDGEDERPERLADPMRHDVGVVHGGQHRASQAPARDREDHRRRVRAPRGSQHQHREDGRHRGP
jgi:hypothetical protein